MRNESFSWLKLLMDLIVVVGICSCSNDDDLSADQEREGLYLSLENNFDAHPERNLNNIQTGDSVLYDLNLNDAHSSRGAKYVFSLNSKNTDHHERLNYDYKAYFLSKESYTSALENDSNKLNLDSLNLLKGDSVVLSSLGKYVLIIVPKIPGSFQHNYSLKKEVGNQTFAVTKENNFNAVRITAWWIDNVLRKGSSGVIGIGSHASKHENDFYIKVEGGERKDDKYLRNDYNAINDCSINYCDTEYSLLDDFVENEPICFYKSGVTKVHAPNVDVKYIKRLKIVKASVEKALLGDTIFIEYWNIPLTQH